MKTLEVTDEQHAFIQHLREEIAEQVVGKYGYVRERDAIQFLIDNLDGDLEIDGEFDPDVPDDLGDAGDDGGDAGDEGFGEGDDESDESGDGETVDFDEEEATADGSDDGDGAPSEDAGESASDSASGDGAASDDDMLDRMMNLLETHDGKWEESPSADYRYRVELPDGSTEDVQTKDDVRALLFKHY